MILAPCPLEPRANQIHMSRKPKKGYFVRGQFVAEGSELDLELKAELKGTHEASRTDLKRESTELQKLGETLLTLRADLMEGLALSEKLSDAVAEAKRITNFEGKRRQMQFIGKLMRGLDADALQAVRDALEAQQKGAAKDALSLHQAEQWRNDLIARESAFDQWLKQYPETDTQQLRALIRQARKDSQPDKESISKGLAPRQGRAYREIFQLVRDQLSMVPAPESESGPTSSSLA
jgi:ribosome-associated protein